LPVSRNGKKRWEEHATRNHITEGLNPSLDWESRVACDEIGKGSTLEQRDREIRVSVANLSDVYNTCNMSSMGNHKLRSFYGVRVANAEGGGKKKALAAVLGVGAAKSNSFGERGDAVVARRFRSGLWQGYRERVPPGGAWNSRKSLITAGASAGKSEQTGGRKVRLSKEV